VRLWDVATGQQVRRFQHNDLVMGVVRPENETTRCRCNW